LRFYNYKRNGTFIEIGAHDGVYLSNTYLLEKTYDWKGICVEPIPNIYSKLKENRNCVCVNKAVYKESDCTIDFLLSPDSQLSGIADHVIDSYKSRYDKIIQVDTITIDDLITQNNFPNYIDYLSIDTEGSELDILKTIDFNKFRFGIIDVEHNFQDEKRKNINDLLTKNSYVFVKENKWDDYYIHSSLQQFIVPDVQKQRKFIWSLR
jgi:FkbM family methyltransferase